MKQKLIASSVGVHPSTICRELRCNIAQRGPAAGSYMASNTQRRCTHRHHDKPKLVKFTEPVKKQAVRWLEAEKCNPDKGTVENRIGQLRRFFPKKTDLQMVTHERVKAVKWLLKNRPVRKFDNKPTNKVLLEKIALIT
jgi:IS30 family transposase